MSHVDVKRVIELVGLPNLEEEIKELINKQNGVKVAKMILLNRGREKIHTMSIKLVYHRGSLLEGVMTNWEYFKIGPFC